MAENNFLPIPDAPGYEINSKGFVRNIHTGKILKAYNQKNFFMVTDTEHGL